VADRRALRQLRRRYGLRRRGGLRAGAGRGRSGRGGARTASPTELDAGAETIVRETFASGRAGLTSAARLRLATVATERRRVRGGTAPCVGAGLHPE